MSLLPENRPAYVHILATVALVLFAFHTERAVSGLTDDRSTSVAVVADPIVIDLSHLPDQDMKAALHRDLEAVRADAERARKHVVTLRRALESTREHQHRDVSVIEIIRR
jgi:hypothetical protein